ncbi:MAG TPA: ATP phosphoribosyltransferase regulatory subunit [Zoogloea sp.]|uniref:ATP phosphoribosyltransferase regulatory subunit n=1 Tax=Zoogloea sp. TaxID=49181 RepID=UPI002C496183|nr:ATP phosphoribosyltransferase regulatory subunit [Zoogloea sp.]HMV16487.1 ATP phosphoribosyltransferase regulatory subunit [Rhodocyclaceae bacterium]HNA66176.1 ATP phosphoribosyltransferase regulatory subunit [Rhodocyclaceae bacterium]HNB63250.1 ATP phosphoribosyltransferase regulatory subunit [Rhodocyclaceae bacterium]HNC80422.1 ATP phosphoribosyltransferase regulatory subunit [Rhodocyclaceae bacterium]HNI47408.1 ATP phosphoribosyltransferase regulatory subunit [Zoogloea sp.]
MRWVLPEHIQDVLPAEAEKLESLRCRLLDAFRLNGYQLVMPPLLEYLESLLTGAGQDLQLKTLKLVDQLSGRTMGVRADITPQVARIDAHLLNRQGVARLCYCGSVAHALPSSLTATREPLQLGAELYGHAGLEADAEVIRLLAESLQIAGVTTSRIDLGHVGLFRALAARAGLRDEQQESLFDCLQSKDIPGLRDLLGDAPEAVRSALLVLPTLYGGPEVLERARGVLSGLDDADVRGALDDLESLSRLLADLPISFDLADLRGYHYHSGVMFAAYGGTSPVALAQGGRYDRVGTAFGRGRPATGFSLDLRELAAQTPDGAGRGMILAGECSAPGFAQEVGRLRASGEIVVIELPGHDGTWREAGCDRRLVLRGGAWQVEPLQGE